MGKRTLRVSQAFACASGAYKKNCHHVIQQHTNKE
jgi:hypothetical protein